MNSINEAVKKGPLMTMTLECETEFPKILKDLMVAMEAHGAAIYKGFPVMDEEWSIGGCNFTCTKTRKTTTKEQDSACTPTLWCTPHSLSQQEKQLGGLSKNLVLESSAECSTSKKT